MSSSNESKSGNSKSDKKPPYDDGSSNKKKSGRKVAESSDEDELERNLPVEIRNEEDPKQKKYMMNQYNNAYTVAFTKADQKYTAEEQTKTRNYVRDCKKEQVKSRYHNTRAVTFHRLFSLIDKILSVQNDALL